MSKISCIIIDEISTLKPYMLAYLNAGLQAACNSTKPFGGLAVIMFGDFDQLPPVGGRSIPEVAMMVLAKTDQEEHHLQQQEMEPHHNRPSRCGAIQNC